MLDQHNAVIRSYQIPGQCWPSELCWLYDTFSRSRSHAEVGVYCGRSLFASAAGMQPGAVIRKTKSVRDPEMTERLKRAKAEGAVRACMGWTRCYADAERRIGETLKGLDALLAGKGDSNGDAAGSPASGGRGVRLADGSILASEGGECPVPPPG